MTPESPTPDAAQSAGTPCCDPAAFLASCLRAMANCLDTCCSPKAAA